MFCLYMWIKVKGVYVHFKDILKTTDFYDMLSFTVPLFRKKNKREQFYTFSHVTFYTTSSSPIIDIYHIFLYFSI